MGMAPLKNGVNAFFPETGQYSRCDLYSLGNVFIIKGELYYEKANIGTDGIDIKVRMGHNCFITPGTGRIRIIAVPHPQVEVVNLSLRDYINTVLKESSDV